MAKNLLQEPLRLPEETNEKAWYETVLTALNPEKTLSEEEQKQLLENLFDPETGERRHRDRLIEPETALDLAKVPTKLLFGTGQALEFLYDTIKDAPVNVHNLLFNKDEDDDPNIVAENENSKRRKRWASLYKDYIKEQYDPVAKAIGATPYEDLPDEQQEEMLDEIRDPVTGRPLTPETIPGMIFDIGTLIVSGIAIARQLPEKMWGAAKFLTAESIAVQTQVDPAFNLATILKELDPDIDEDSAIKWVTSHPIINALAADELTPELMQRVQTFGIDTFLTLGITGLFKAAGFSIKHAQQYSKKYYNKSLEELDKWEAARLLEDTVLLSRSQQIRKSMGKGVAYVSGIGIPDIPLIRKLMNKKTKAEAQIIRQNTQKNANIIQKTASFLYRFKQRYFTSRGYAPSEVFESEQGMIRRTRALRTEADSISKRLQYYMDNIITEYDGDIIKNVTDAFQTNLSHLDSDKHLKILQSEFNLPEEIATEVLNARSMIDRLSQIILDSNIGSEPVREAIAQNLGDYVKRSYRMFEEKNFTPSNSARRKAEKYFQDQFLAGKHKINIDELEEGFDWEDLGLSQKEILEGATFADRHLIEFLEIGAEKNFDKFMSKVMSVNNSLLKGRKNIPKELRELMGEIESPPLNIIHTVNKLSQIIESNKYYNNVLELGGSVPSNRELYEISLDKARYKLRNTDLTELEELTGTKNIIPDGEFVNVRSDVTGDFTVGKVIKSSDEGYTIEIKDFNTQRTTEQFIPSERVKPNEDAIEGTFDLELIPRTRIVKKLADKMYVDEFKNADMGNPFTEPKYIFDKTQGDTSIFNVKIDMPGNPLHGKWTTKEFYQSLQGLEDYAFLSTTIKNSKWWNRWRYVKGVSQSFKTVWDWTTQNRNNLGGMQFALNNGMNPFKGGTGNFKILMNQMGNLPTEEFTRHYNRLQELGIVNTSVRGGEWQSLMKQMDGATPEEFEKRIAEFIQKVKDPIWKGKPSDFDSVKTKWYQYPQKMYMAIDDFYKMNAYAEELSWLKKVPANKNKSLLQLEEEAAEIVRNTFPNYDLIPKGLKALKDLPIGNFVAFTPEIIRTQGYILKQIVKELTTPGLKERGLRRLAGGLLVHTGWAGAGVGSMKLLSWDEQHLEAINTLSEAPWSDRHNKIPIEINGKLGVINPMYLNPYDVFHGVYQDIQTALNKGELENLDTDTMIAQAVFKAGTEMISFATDKAMVADVILDLGVAFSNDRGVTGEGKLIFKSKDPEDIIWGLLSYTAEQLSPGVILDAKKLLYDLPMGTINPATGEKLSPELVLLEMATGFNVRPVNAEKSLIFSASRFKGEKGHRIRKASMENRGDPRDWADDFMRQNSEKFNISRNMHRQVVAARNMGMHDSEIIDILIHKAFLSESEAKEVVANKFKPYTITKNAKDKYKEYYGEGDEKVLGSEATKVLDNMVRYVSDITNISLYSRKTREVERIQRLREGRGTGFYQFGPARNYKDLEKRYRINLDFAKGGVVTEENPVPNAPKEPDGRIDKMTGLPYDRQAGEDEDDLLRLLGFGREPRVLGGAAGITNILRGVAKRAATKAIKTTDDVPAPTTKRIVSSRPITEVVPDRVTAERAVALDLTTEAFHGTLSDIKAFEIGTTDFGVHVGTPKQAWSRVKDKIEEERMGDEIFQRKKDAEYLEDLLKDKKLDPKMRKKLNAEANRLQKGPSLEDYMEGANIIPVLVKAKNPLRITADIGEWRQVDKVIDGLLESDLIKKLQVNSGEKITDQAIVKKLKSFQRRAKRLEKPYHGEDPADSSSKLFDVDSYYKDKKTISLVGEIKKFIQDQGYDSIIYRNTYESILGKAEDSLIIFDTKNIRSRFAEFDPKYKESADILKAMGGAIRQRRLGFGREPKVFGALAKVIARRGATKIRAATDEAADVAPIKAIDKTQSNWEQLNITDEAIENWRASRSKPKVETDEASELAARALADESIPMEKRIKDFKEATPITLYDRETSETILNNLPSNRDVALSVGKKSNRKDRKIIGFNDNLKTGELIEFRLDIPAYKDYGVWTLTAHRPVKGKSIGTVVAYGKTGHLKNVSFKAEYPESTYKIATGESDKFPMATMKGKWVEHGSEELAEKARAILKDSLDPNNTEWTQIGFNPKKGSQFYDKATRKIIESADEVIQIGPLVLAKNAKLLDVTPIFFREGKLIPFIMGGKVKSRHTMINKFNNFISASNKQKALSEFKNVI